MAVYSPQDYVIYIGILLVVLYLLKKYFFSKIAFDRHFVYATAPYILVGIFIRLLADAGVIEKSQFWSVTPGVYLLTAVIFLVFAALGLFAEKRYKKPYWRVPCIAGTLIFLILAWTLFSNAPHLERIFEPIMLAAGVTLLTYIIARALNLTVYLEKENLAIIFAHLLDGCATYLALNTYPVLEEEHLLPRKLIELAGGDAFIMVPVKFFLIILVVYFLEKWHREEKEKDELTYRMIKFLLFILGIGPGIRDVFIPTLLS